MEQEREEAEFKHEADERKNEQIRQMQEQISRMHSDEKRAMLALGRIYEIAKGQVDTGKSDDDVLRRWIETGE